MVKKNKKMRFRFKLLTIKSQLGSNLVAKIADLDSARLQPSSQLSVHSSTKKTLQWTAPELFRGKMVTKKVDVYSLSVIIWEILTQKTPWDGLNEFEVMGNIFNNLRPEIPQHASSHVRIMLEKGWANTPEQRLEAQDVADAMHEELERHTRALLKAQLESGANSSTKGGPLKTYSEVTPNGGGQDKRKRSHTSNQPNNPTSPLVHSRTRSEIPTDEEEPPSRHSAALTRKASLMFNKKEDSRLNASQGLKRTRSIDNMHPFVTVPLTPPTPKRAADNSNPNASIRIGLRSDSRTENRSDSQTDSRTDSALWNESKNDSRSDTRSDSSMSDCKSDSSDSSDSSESTNSSDTSKSDVKTSPESPKVINTDNRKLSSQGVQAFRTLKRSDSNPNVRSTLLQRTLRRTESVKTIAPPQADGKLDSPRGRSGSVGDIAPNERGGLRNNFMFTRSESREGLKYSVSSIPSDDVPQRLEKSPLSNSSNINNHHHHHASKLYNHDGYNTGEIHKEAVQQFNVNYLDDYIDHINPKLATINESSSQDLSLSSIVAEQGDGVTLNDSREVPKPDYRNYNRRLEQSVELELEEEAEVEVEAEVEEEVEQLVELAHDTSISYEVNGDEDLDDDVDEERRQKEEQEKYMDVYSGPIDESERDMSSVSGSFKWDKRK